jgi:phage shock protein PspC (stress-responsive transcriptional regulator)
MLLKITFGRVRDSPPDLVRLIMFLSCLFSFMVDFYIVSSSPNR